MGFVFVIFLLISIFKIETYCIAMMGDDEADDMNKMLTTESLPPNIKIFTQIPNTRQRTRQHTKIQQTVSQKHKVATQELTECKKKK